MKEVDFLPDWYLQRMARRGERRRHTVWMVLMLGAMATWTLWTQGQIEQAEALLVDTRRARALQEPLAAHSAALQQELTKLRAKLALCGNLSGGAELHAVLSELSHHQPDGVVLGGFAILQEDRLGPSGGEDAPAHAEVERLPVPERNMTLRGYARAESDVGKYIYALADSGVFEDVQLTFSRPADVFDVTVREFEIRCRLPQFE